MLLEFGLTTDHKFCWHCHISDEGEVWGCPSTLGVHIGHLFVIFLDAFVCISDTSHLYVNGTVNATDNIIIIIIIIIIAYIPTEVQCIIASRCEDN